MKTVYSPKHHGHAGNVELVAGAIVPAFEMPSRAEYIRSRVEAVTAAFTARRVPLIWAGAPPMQNTRLSTDLTVLNDVFRKSVEAAERQDGGQSLTLEL